MADDPIGDLAGVEGSAPSAAIRRRVRARSGCFSFGGGWSKDGAGSSPSTRKMRNVSGSLPITRCWDAISRL
jgi:hypothetical protein